MNLKYLFNGLAAATLLNTGASALADPGNSPSTTGVTEPTVTEKIENRTRSAANKTERVASDSWITTKVKSSLLADDITKGFEINVKTKRKVVTLSGTVDSKDSADHAAELAKAIEGVSSVDTGGLKVVNKVSSN